ncbi:MAG: zinc dependent phospholipase C family protein [Lachnospiraceae bacterium]|nr:zinc dependent phospholipase C family protein [Lachnospiraceae bacterium]
MPALYAHYRFGAACLEALPEDLAALCRRHRDLYDLGVHGPDIFFYYKPLQKNDVSAFGLALHFQKSRAFFARGAAHIRTLPEGDERDAALAYLMGFLAHFTLDRCCHGFINAQTAAGPDSHNLIESRLEACLMKMDHLAPEKVDRARYLNPSPAAARVIAGFFDFPEDTVLTAINGQRRVMKLLYSPTGFKKMVLRQLIKVLHIGGGFGDLFIDPVTEAWMAGVAGHRAAGVAGLRIAGVAGHRNTVADPDMETVTAGTDSAAITATILNDMAQAAALWPEVSRALLQTIADNEPLPEAFDHDFEGQ